MVEQGPEAWNLKCVASTNVPGDTPVPSDQNLLPGQSLAGSPEHRVTRGTPSNYFKSADWTADGTTIVTNSADNHIRTFVLPPDLLEEKEVPHSITPYYTLCSKEPVYSLSIYPFFSLQDTSAAILLSSVRDHPIRLTSALYPGLIASYSLISPTTEAFITPHSILYPATLTGTHFLTGSDSLICLFDVSRPGKDGPVSRMPTIPSKRNKMVGGGIGMKGIISTLAENPSGDGIVAAGTFTRHIGLYASHGSGDTIATFSVAGTEAERRVGGKGVTQVLWSPCGRYLYVAERKSDGMLIYDIRVTGQLVGWLKGRQAMTNQRLNIDVVSSGADGSHEIWAGGTDGYIRMWESPTVVGGEVQPTWEKRIHDDPVSSAVFHPMGSVLATCSGQKRYPEYSDENRGLNCPTPDRPECHQMDNSLRVWQL
ncbi:uncharacterized protein CIMG_09668 [Coccidioides immitis RS]|uniref:Guanine nucleotide-binding protein n=1 Tax=Coccidioides immitis (strain RS) TaxID=246410 RepID=J3K2V9_COCIM|nr:uncharacterized protein CIMG_09668 [Coccidioides immitis RS]EAS28464.3 hypothetical protein CIMG_09668 [Coccidioides immitis RS]